MEFDKKKSYKQFLECEKDNEQFFAENSEVEIYATERVDYQGSITRKYGGIIKLSKKDEIGTAIIPVLKTVLFTDTFLTSEQEFFYEKELKKLRINFNFNEIEPFSKYLIEVQFPFFNKNE